MILWLLFIVFVWVTWWIALLGEDFCFASQIEVPIRFEEDRIAHGDLQRKIEGAALAF